MDIRTTTHELSSEGRTAIHDITSAVRETVDETGFGEGQVTVFSVGSTSGISTLEFEPGLVKHDIAAMFERLAPYDEAWRHNLTWGDDNGSSHLRSFLTGTSLTVPFEGGRLILGTWQQIVLVDYDTRPRKRRFVVQVLGK